MNQPPIASLSRPPVTVFRLAVFALVVAIGFVTGSRAQDIISLKLTTTTSSFQNTMFAGDFAGAPGVRTNHWNNMFVTNGNSISTYTNLAGSITNSAGNVVPGLQTVIYFGGGGSDGYFNRQNGATNDGKMFADVADVYGNNAFANYGFFDITNIPYTNYNIYCYFRDDNGNGSGNTRGGFWLITNTPSGSQRFYVKNQSNDVNFTQLPLTSNTGGGYVQSTTTSIPGGGAAWTSIQGGNYVEFTGLTNSWTRIWFGGLGNGSGAKDDLGNYVNGGSPAIRFKLPAFQIVQVLGGVATNLYFVPGTSTLHAGDRASSGAVVDADYLGGPASVNVTAGCTFASDNSSVVTVSATGALTPGTNGTAHVIAQYQSLFATNTVTVVGPTSLSLSIVNTNLLLGNGIGDTTTATLYANFSDAANVPVNTFQFVSFSGTSDLTVVSNGTLTATGLGSFSVTGTYDGMSVTANNAGSITAWANPLSVPALGVHFTSASEKMLFHDVSGYSGVRGGYWNNFVQATGLVTNQLVNPTDSQGNVLNNTVVQVIPDFGGILDNQTLDQVGTITTNESTLFGLLLDYGMNNGTTVPSELIVSNIPYASYDVYFYLWNDTSATNRPAEFTIDGVTQYRINNAAFASQPANNGTGYVIAAPQTGSLPASIVNVPFGNVVKFSGITDSTLVAQWAGVGQDYIGDANGVTRVRLAGFQIVSSLTGLHATNTYLSPPNVPYQLPGNPATYALTLLADFSNGTKGGNITALPGVNYASSNPGIFGVDTNGNITPGLTPGVATLTITYQTNTLSVFVTNAAPTSVTVAATPNTVYINGSLGAEPSHASVLASFPGNPGVNISGFSGVTYVDQGSPVATLNSDGSISVNSVGQANLGATYLGTTYVGVNAFTVLNTGGTPKLVHLYDFTNTTQVIDSVGGANGTIHPPTSGNLPITLDGHRAIFPGDGIYSTAPYISLPPGMISAMGDVTIELWCGRTATTAWARFVGFGNTPKGTDPHILGGTATSGLQLLASYAGSGNGDFSGTGGGDLYTGTLANNTEYHIVAICAPNANVTALYVNGVLVTNGLPIAEFLNVLVNDTVDWLGVSLSNDDTPLNGWINRLAIYEGVMSSSQVMADYTAGTNVFLPPISLTPVPVTFSVTGGNLNLSWPSDHLGWKLQSQTNTLSAGLGNNWTTVAGSTSVTSLVISINPANNCVFYRLVSP